MLMQIGIFLLVPIIHQISSSTLNCHFNDRLNEISKEKLYTCVPESTIWQKFSIDVSKVTGQHLINHGNKDVNSFSIWNQQNVNFLPTGLDHYFPNLALINARNSNLKGIFYENFQRFSKLKFAILNHNQIQGIKSGIFDNNPLLEMVYLDFNDIKQIDSKSFGNLKQLKSLYLSENYCHDLLFNAFNHLDVLKLTEKINKGACISPAIPKSIKIISELKPITIKNEKIIENLHKRITRLIKCLQATIGVLVITAIVLLIIITAFIRTRRLRSERDEPIINYDDDDDDENIIRPPLRANVSRKHGHDSRHSSLIKNPGQYQTIPVIEIEDTDRSSARETQDNHQSDQGIQNGHSSTQKTQNDYQKTQADSQNAEMSQNNPSTVQVTHADLPYGKSTQADEVLYDEPILLPTLIKNDENLSKNVQVTPADHKNSQTTHDDRNSDQIAQSDLQKSQNSNVYQKSVQMTQDNPVNPQITQVDYQKSQNTEVDNKNANMTLAEHEKVHMTQANPINPQMTQVEHQKVQKVKDDPKNSQLAQFEHPYAQFDHQKSKNTQKSDLLIHSEQKDSSVLQDDVLIYDEPTISSKSINEDENRASGSTTSSSSQGGYKFTLTDRDDDDDPNSMAKFLREMRAKQARKGIRVNSRVYDKNVMDEEEEIVVKGGVMERIKLLGEKSVRGSK